MNWFLYDRDPVMKELMFVTTKTVNSLTGAFKAFALCIVTPDSTRKNPVLKILKKKTSKISNTSIQF